MDDNGNSEAQSGYGSGFFLTVKGTKIEIDEVTKLAFAEEAADDFEVTHFKSPGKRKEYRTGLTEPGEDTIEINYVPGSPTDEAFRDARESGEVCPYESYIPAPEGKWLKTSGFLIVKSRSKAVPINDRMSQTIGVRFTGATVEAAADSQPGTPAAGGE